MGGSESTEKNTEPVTYPNKFDKSWRNTPWHEKERLEKNLREFQLSHPEVKYVRILIAGDVGAGKSSFINSINSVFQKRITTLAPVNSTSSTSFTKVYRTYSIKSGGSILPFVFNDVMGLESEESHGVQPEDIVKALQGFLKEGHKVRETHTFNPASCVSVGDAGYRNNPAPQHQTYCLVYVMAADKVSLMASDVLKKFQYVRKKASDLEISQVIIMTRVDELCPLVNKDLKNIYLSKKIKEKMQECSNLVGVPMNQIFPVKNYHEEIDTQNDIDVLLLKALTHIVETANDLLDRKEDENEQFK